MRSRTRAVLAILLLVELCWPLAQIEARVSSSAPAKTLLDPDSFHPYFTEFIDQERAFLHDDPTLQWDWFLQNIPWLDIPDKGLEEIYYFRWYSFQKHIRRSPEGLVIDEFLDKVHWAGKYNTINAASLHHLREARWLRNPDYVEQYSRFWFSPSGEPRRYSFPAADAIYSVSLATGNKALPVSLLPDLISNYKAWEKTHRDPNGLFWQIDDLDGMEYSIGGSGYRPTINSYMYGDAVAISKIAATAGDTALSQEYAEKARQIRYLIERRLWNPGAEFYETVPRGQSTTWVNVRELVGYVPWYFDLPHPDRAIAWKQLNDPEGFAGKYGPTTAERRTPRFRFAADHECLWNGPSWPFATTQTLVALANLLNGPPQDVIGKGQYFALLSTYAQSQHIKLPNGNSIPWIDEDLDPDTGLWIARDTLEEKKQPPPNRGRYYNHSGFADLIITGLIGIRPSPGNVLTIHPLIPAGKWEYFALDRLPYHGHLLTIYYDATGSRYQRGKGIHVLCDGHEIASRLAWTPFTVKLPKLSLGKELRPRRAVTAH